MAVIVSVTADASSINLKLAALPDDVRAALTEAIIDQGHALASLVRSRAEALLRHSSGKYLASISFSMRSGSTVQGGSVRATDPVAHILEYGATLPARDILPNKANALKFEGRFAARVKFPGARIAPRDIIHGAFKQKQAAITAAMEKAVQDAASHASDEP